MPADPNDPDLIVARTPDERAYVEALVGSGQAVKEDDKPPVGRGVTHIIVGYQGDGFPILKRIRFENSYLSGRPPGP